MLVLQDVNEAFEELEEGNEDALKVRCMPTLTILICPAMTVSLGGALNALPPAPATSAQSPPDDEISSSAVTVSAGHL